MTGPTVFMMLCLAIWPGPDWRVKAAAFLQVRESTVVKWSTGKRTYPPAVLESLLGLATTRAGLMNTAATEARTYLKVAA